MNRPALIIGGVFAIGAMVVVLGELGALNTETWTREHPLSNTIAVASVHDGVLALSDGRRLRPAGVHRCEGISAEEYDHTIQVIAAQGIVIMRDLGDGRAFLQAEPKFYNWCGTRRYGANPWGHWAGGYFQCPVSELLVAGHLADPDAEAAGLSNRERWRLKGAAKFEFVPTISKQSKALRFDGNVVQLRDLDFALDSLGESAPTD